MKKSTSILICVLICVIGAGLFNLIFQMVPEIYKFGAAFFGGALSTSVAIPLAIHYSLKK